MEGADTRRGGSTYRTASTGLVRDVNRSAILRLIGSSAPIARHQIARQLGLSSAAVTQITRGLIEQGLIRVAERAPSRGGRPALLLELVGGAATAFGMKVASDHLVGVRVDLEAEVLERFECKFDATAKGAIDRLGDVLVEWVDSSANYAPLLGVGLGVPGVFDRRAQTLDSPLLGWHGIDLAAMVQERLGVPVFVDNDVNTLAVWERLYGRGTNVEDFLVVTIGRGVGLGIVVGGDIYRGFRGGAGEFGHVTAVEDGPRCSCGKHGCLEALIGDPALIAQARETGLLSPRQGIARLDSLAKSGDERALGIYATAGAALGRAVSNLVNVLAPELVLLSGEGTRAWDALAPAFDRELRAHLFPTFAGVAVEVDPWDDAKWAVGAASLVLRATFTTPLGGEQDERVRARIETGAATAGVVA